MSFAIREQGERSKLIAHIQTIKESGTDGKEAKDQSQIKTAVAAAVSEINALSKDFNSALVMVEGHASEHQRSVTIQVIGQKSHV